MCTGVLVPTASRCCPPLGCAAASHRWGPVFLRLGSVLPKQSEHRPPTLKPAGQKNAVLRAWAYHDRVVGSQENQDRTIGQKCQNSRKTNIRRLRGAGGLAVQRLGPKNRSSGEGLISENTMAGPWPEALNLDFHAVRNLSPKALRGERRVPKTI